MKTARAMRKSFFFVGYCSLCSTDISISSKKRQSTNVVDLSTIGGKKHRSISSFFTRFAKPTKNLSPEQDSTVNTKKSTESHMTPTASVDKSMSTRAKIEQRLRSVKGNTVESNWKKDIEDADVWLEYKLNGEGWLISMSCKVCAMHYLQLARRLLRR